MRRLHVLGLLSWSLSWTTCLASVTTTPPLTQELPADAQEARYRESLLRRPEATATFDRWLELLRDTGSVEETREALEATPESFPHRILVGRLHAAQGRAARALAAWREAEALNPTSHLPARLRARLHIRAHEYEAAEAALTDAWTKAPSGEDGVDIGRELGQIQLRLGRRDAALATWRSLIRRAPDDFALVEELAELLEQEGELEEATAVWTRLRQASVGEASRVFRCDLALGALLIERGERDRAIEHFQGMLATVDATSWQARRTREQLIECFLDADDWDGFIAFGLRWLDAQPGDLAMRQDVADAHLRIGQTDQALEGLHAAIRLAPTSLDLRRTLRDLLTRLGRFDEAIEVGRDLLHLAADQPDESFALAVLILQKDEASDLACEEAIALWRKVTAQRPDDAQLAARVAEEALRARTLRRKFLRIWQSEAQEPSPFEPVALEFLQRAWTLAPESIDHGLAYAELLWNFERRAEAREAWTALVAPPFDQADRHQRIANAQRTLKLTDEAIASLGRAIQRNPMSFRLRHLRHRWQVEDAAFSAAVQEVDALESTATSYQETSIALDARIQLANELDRLADELTSAQAQPDADRTARDWWYIGRILRSVGRAREAQRALAQVTTMEPAHDSAATEEAEVLVELGELRPAAERYAALAGSVPRRASEFLTLLVGLRTQLGEHEEARRVADRLIQRAPERAEFRTLRADLAFERGDLDDGLRVLRQAVSTLPDDLDLRSALANRLLGQGIPERAREAQTHLWRLFDRTTDFDARSRLIAVMAQATTIAGNGDDDVVRRLTRRATHATEGWNAGLCLATYQLQKSHPAKARAALATTEVSIPDDLSVLRTATQLGEGATDLSYAARMQERIVSLDPREVELERLALLYSRSGEHEAARRTWVRTLSLTHASEAFLRRVENLVRESQLVEALDLLGAGLEVEPDRWQLLDRAATIAFVLNRTDEARVLFKRLATHGQGGLLPGGIDISHLEPSPEPPHPSPFISRTRLREDARTPHSFLSGGLRVTYRDELVTIHPQVHDFTPVLAHANDRGAFTGLRPDRVSPFVWPGCAPMEMAWGLQGASRPTRDRLVSLRTLHRNSSLPWDGVDEPESRTRALLMLPYVDAEVEAQPETLDEARAQTVALLGADRLTEALVAAASLRALAPDDALGHALHLLELDRRIAGEFDAPMDDPQAFSTSVDTLAQQHPEHANALYRAFALRSALLLPESVTEHALSQLARARDATRLCALIPHFNSLPSNTLVDSTFRHVTPLVSDPQVDPDDRKLWMLMALEFGPDDMLDAVLDAFGSSLPTSVDVPLHLADSDVHRIVAEGAYALMSLNLPCALGPMDGEHAALLTLLSQRLTRAGRADALAQWCDAQVATATDEGRPHFEVAALQARWLAGARAEVIDQLDSWADDGPFTESARAALARAMVLEERWAEARAALDGLGGFSDREERLYEYRQAARNAQVDDAMIALQAELRLEYDTPDLSPFLPVATPTPTSQVDTAPQFRLFHAFGFRIGIEFFRGPPSDNPSTTMAQLVARARERDSLDHLIASLERQIERCGEKESLTAALALARGTTPDTP